MVAGRMSSDLAECPRIALAAEEADYSSSASLRPLKYRRARGDRFTELLVNGLRAAGGVCVAIVTGSIILILLGAVILLPYTHSGANKPWSRQSLSASSAETTVRAVTSGNSHWLGGLWKGRGSARLRKWDPVAAKAVLTSANETVKAAGKSAAPKAPQLGSFSYNGSGGNGSSSGNNTARSAVGGGNDGHRRGSGNASNIDNASRGSRNNDLGSRNTDETTTNSGDRGKRSSSSNKKVNGSHDDKEVSGNQSSATTEHGSGSVASKSSSRGGPGGDSTPKGVGSNVNGISGSAKSTRALP